MNTSETASAESPVKSSESAIDYRAHEMTYAGFLHLLRWFVIHLGLLLVGLYFLMMQGNGLGGTLFIVLAVGAIGYGVVTIGRTADHAAEHPEDWHGAARDQGTEKN